MNDPVCVMHFSIGSMRRANEELTNISEELSVGIELHAFNVETLWRTLQVIAEFLDCDSLQCQSGLDDIEK
jgi:hypothetical protein